MYESKCRLSDWKRDRLIAHFVAGTSATRTLCQQDADRRGPDDRPFARNWPAGVTSEFPMLARSGHFGPRQQCSLSGVKRTLQEVTRMSACDPKRSFKAIINFNLSAAYVILA